MKISLTTKYIVKWLSNYCNESNFKGFIVGISGGIDSAVTSLICAKTTKMTLVANMPIFQEPDQLSRAKEHIMWLKSKFSNVSEVSIDLSSIFETFRKVLSKNNDISDLSFANSRSRIRMAVLYALANSKKLLVVGTGNKVEDFGIGFYTKYGDGGVDISPIANLTKSQVYAIGKAEKVDKRILNAEPSDGLWDDDRTDESQIGATYFELEWAMNYLAKKPKDCILKERDRKILKIYENFRKKNLHKMSPVPVCVIPKNLL